MSNRNLSFDEEEENMTTFRPVMDEEYVRAVNEYWRQVEVSDCFDIEDVLPVRGMMHGLMLYESYDPWVDLYARVGLQRYNMKEGTNFEFQRLIKFNKVMHFVSSYYITLAACDTDSRGSMKIFQVQVNENCLGSLDLTCSVARLKGDTTSKHFPPQGDYVVRLALPRWPTDEAFNIMQVNGSELLDSIRVYLELAVRKHDMRILDDDLSKLEIVRVSMETSNGDMELTNERLNAKNATFYITFKVVASGGIAEDVQRVRKSIVRRVVNESTGDLSLRGHLF